MHRGQITVTNLFNILTPVHTLVIAVTSALMANTAHAWGTEGHQVVALIAQAQLTPKARTEVDRLLAQEPGETLESISTWADEHRSPATAAWHYVNFPRDTCRYVPQRECPDGKCVVGAIQTQLEVLASTATDDKRLLALKYLVHFVGDVHQPLHAGYLDDKGGNTYQLQAFMRGTNLHAVWDTGLIKNLSLSSDELAERLSKGTSASQASNLSPSFAAEESCKIVSSEGYYPDRKLGQDYIDKFTPVAEQRLRIAGDRLAGILNACWQTSSRGWVASYGFESNGAKALEELTLVFGESLDCRKLYGLPSLKTISLLSPCPQTVYANGPGWNPSLARPPGKRS